MSDGKLEKPTQSQQDKNPAAPAAPAQSQEPEGRGLRAGAGFQAVLDQRRHAIESVRYRATRGASGVAPAGHIAAERREIIGTAAARIMRKGTGAAGTGQIPKTTGSPLPADVRAKMEPKLGADLSSVKVHTGGDSAQAASSFGARAFTVGSDVHFNSGEFAPGTKEGDKLLAHELTHVVQGQKSGVQRKAEEGDEHTDREKRGPEVSDPDEPAEKEADAKSEEVASDLHDEKQGTSDVKADNMADRNPRDRAEAKGADGANGEAETKQKEDNTGEKPPEQKSAPISAKLEGVGRKVFATKKDPSPAPTPKGSPTGSATKPKPDPQKVAVEVKAALEAGLGEKVTKDDAPKVGQTLSTVHSAHKESGLKSLEVVKAGPGDGALEVRGEIDGAPLVKKKLSFFSQRDVDIRGASGKKGQQHTMAMGRVDGRQVGTKKFESNSDEHAEKQLANFIMANWAALSKPPAGPFLPNKTQTLEVIITRSPCSIEGHDCTQLLLGTLKPFLDGKKDKKNGGYDVNLSVQALSLHGRTDKEVAQARAALERLFAGGIDLSIRTVDDLKRDKILKDCEFDDSVIKAIEADLDKVNAAIKDITSKRSG